MFIRLHFKGGHNLQNVEQISQQTGHSVLFLKRNWCCKKTSLSTQSHCTIFKIHQSTIKYAWLLGRWGKWIVDQASDVPSIIFFSWFLAKCYAKNPFNSFSYFFYKITKIKIKSFDCPTSIKSIKKNSTWNIKLLDDNSFAPSSKQASLIYCRLTDL